jgi:hypothetical protein
MMQICKRDVSLFSSNEKKEKNETRANPKIGNNNKQVGMIYRPLLAFFCRQMCNELD